MGQERRDDVLDPDPKRAAGLLSRRQCLLAEAHQNFTEMEIGAHDGQSATLIPEHDGVIGGRELRPAAKEPVVLGQVL